MGKIITQYFFAWDEWVMVRTFSEFFFAGHKIQRIFNKCLSYDPHAPRPPRPRKIINLITLNQNHPQYLIEQPQQYPPPPSTLKLQYQSFLVLQDFFFTSFYAYN